MDNPIGFSDLKFEALKNFSTCSPIMSTSFDNNWVTSSQITYANLFM